MNTTSTLVFVYFNLHRKLWSVKALQGPMRGRVIAHRVNLSLTGAEFRVSEAGRQRVLREQRKNVHAGVVGYWSADAAEPDVSGGVAVTYNPYKAPTFTRRDTDEPVHSARLVKFNGRSVLAAVAA